MDTYSETVLTDLSTGTEYRRTATGEATMTTEIICHPYRQLEGAAFITLRDVSVLVNDDIWERVLGMRLVLPGGVEVDVDAQELEKALEDIEECDHDFGDAVERRPDLFCRDESKDLDLDLLVPVVVNDTDLPPARCLVPLGAILSAFQRGEPGVGQFARGGIEERAPAVCGHSAKDIGRYRCRSCLRRWWTIRAREMGIIDE